MTAWSVRSGESESQGPGIAARGCQSLFFLVFLGMGLLFTGFVVFGFFQKFKPYTWKATPCAIQLGAITEKSVDGGTTYRFEVEYAYDWEGRRYRGTVLEDGYSGSTDATEAHRLAERYKPDAKTTCYVNPSNPAEAVLRRGGLWIGLFVFIPLIFVAVGAWGIYSAWRRRPAAEEKERAPVSSQASSRAARFTPLFFLIFFAFGAVFLFFAFIQPLVRIREAQSWPETPCVVLSSQVRSHSDSDGTTYNVDILYRYQIGDREFKSNRYDFMGGSSSGYQGKKEIVDRYPPGAQTVCYVNPRDPADAVLHRGTSAAMWFGLIPLVFVLIGVIGFFASWRWARRRAAAPPAAAWMPKAVPDRGRDARREGWAAAAPRGPVTLKPKASPIAQFLGLCFAALFWNGIVVVFAVQAAGGVSRGEWIFGWFLAIFLIPFVLVGLFLIGAVVYQFLALFNPRPEVTVSSGVIPLGGSVEVTWKFAGLSRRIRRFRMFLEGREEATYRRGTDTVTDKRVFARLDLTDARSPYEIRSGRVTLRIPAEAMHSFECDNNKIIWTIRIHGEIDRWPDVKEEFPIVVLPSAERA
jgi:MFS family permease